MKSKTNNIKHREYQRARNRKNSELLLRLFKVIPYDDSLKNTKANILKCACEYIEFQIKCYNELSAIIEADRTISNIIAKMKFNDYVKEHGMHMDPTVSTSFSVVGSSGAGNMTSGVGGAMVCRISGRIRPPPNKRIKLSDSLPGPSDSQLWELESNLPDELASTPSSSSNAPSAYDSLTNNDSLLTATNVTLINSSIPMSHIGISSSANVVNTTSVTSNKLQPPAQTQQTQQQQQPNPQQTSLPAQIHQQLSQLRQAKTQSPNVLVQQQQKLIPTIIQPLMIVGIVPGSRPLQRYTNPSNILPPLQQQTHMQLLSPQYIPHQKFGSSLYSDNQKQQQGPFRYTPPPFSQSLNQPGPQLIQTLPNQYKKLHLVKIAPKQSIWCLLLSNLIPKGSQLIVQENHQYTPYFKHN